MEDKEQTIDDILVMIEKKKEQIFYGQMADFMDFELDARLKRELAELQEQLQEILLNEDTEGK